MDHVNQKAPRSSRRPTILKFLRRFVVMLIGIVLALVVGGVAVILFKGWQAIFPGTQSTAERLAMFPEASPPLDGPVQIHWDNYQIPHIDATTDHDAAFVLGMVHAHLREGQMAVLKRVSQGRLSEMAGPATVDIDVALRTLDLGMAADEIARTMPDDTRSWIEPFIEGVNFYQDNAARTPPEYGLLGIDREPYTMRDLLTLSRLAGVDVNWFAYFSLLANRKASNWDELWQRAVELGTSGPPSIRNGRKLEELQRLLYQSSRAGSNSIVVSSKKSANGSGMIANDPHLGFSIPNFWMLVGVNSPSYDCVGMMIPGLPFFALGRNEHIAWGGTNMRSASSDLYDISNLPPDSIDSRIEHIDVRFWRDSDVTIRRSSHGPVISDARLIPIPPGDSLALKWVGHQPSDDIGAFLRANRATSLEQFVTAFESYAVSGQNMLAVDDHGNIAMTMAVTLPVRAYATPPDLVLDATNPEHQWQGFVNATHLPIAVNPPEGFICSANNKPSDRNPPIGYLFSLPERINRLNHLMTQDAPITHENLESLQRDVYSESAHALKARLIAVIDTLGLASNESTLQVELKRWDGHYHDSTRGPLAFELLTYHLLQLMADRGSSPFQIRYWPYVSEYLAVDLLSLPQIESRRILDSALTLAEGDFRPFESWGDMHRLRAGFLVAWVPLLGERFTYDMFPVGGSRETVMKTNHEFTNERHVSTYGSQSRHISLMDDLDHNYFLLFGGNDGWLGSENLVDHLPLWKSGEYIQLPLREATARKQSSYTHELSPGRTTRLVASEKALGDAR